jgi:putative FmdB family regulatory protein
MYEYKCPNGHVFERFHGMNDASPETCEICDEGPVQRVLYPVAVHFKGSGFYSTDYGRAARKKESKDGSEPAKSDSGGDGDGKTEKKAAEA